MKKTYIAIALLLGVFVAPVALAGPAADAAVALAAADSKASLGAICNAAYKAVLAEPEQAAEIYEAILAQRTTWTAGQCDAIFRSILMARPDLGGNLSSYVRTYKGGKNAKDAPSAPEGMHPELYDMLNVLYQASLEDGVPEETVNEIMITYGSTIAHEPGIPVELIVTPADTSPSR